MNDQQRRIRSKWKKSNIRVTRKLRDILHGYIMSDGFVKSSGGLTVEQTSKQRKFVEWLYFQLAILRTDTPIREVQRIHPRTGKQSRSLRFQTRNLLRGFHAMWYCPKVHENKLRYTKRLPKNLKCVFNATFVTVWFAGDGTRTVGHRGAKFEVTSCTPEERQILKTLFKQKLNIEVRILRAGKTRTGNPQWTLCVPAAEYEKFRKLITQMDLIPNIFPHKLCKKLDA
uniref:Putative LAGLIDADG homing endonuclease n=1 Tax=Bryopsis plumosa TaxID=3130 RepID=A0A0D6E2P0_BRYPL|nr:putative LAGLIDADG homing endonuclease [Bryopsis plumosa]CEO91042.1 putative LAGLIDADG homing endonuclease [Bryopsis plumosa]